MGIRWDRLQWEALWNSKGEDGPGQFGEQSPEDGVNKQEWERDWDQEWLFESPKEESSREEDIAREGEASNAVEVEEN
jgi:hypothetical protein